MYRKSPLFSTIMSGGHISIRVEDDEIVVEQHYSYSGDTNKLDLLPMMSGIVETAKGWGIVDETEHLTMVHYEDESDLSVSGKVRGILLDTEKKIVVASSYGHTPVTVQDRIENFDFVDTDGVKHSFTDPIIRPIFEGVVMRAIRNKGENYLISHKRIKTSKSRWGNSKTFPNMYKEAGGPSFEELFDQTKDYSTTCYYFLVVHPELLIATRQSIEAPYIVFLDKEEMFESNETSVVGLYSPPEPTRLESRMNKSGVYVPENMSVEAANKHLNCGYYKAYEAADPRFSLGESVIVYEKENGKIKDLVRINSTGFAWRFDMRSNNANIYHRMFELFDKPMEVIPLSITPEALKQREKPTLCPKTSEKNQNGHYESIWMNYVVSLPMSSQVEALGFLDRYRSDLQGLHDGLIRISKERLEKKDDCPFLARTFVRNAKNEAIVGSEIPNKLAEYIKKCKKTILYTLIKDVREFLA
jgi:hypothetical protein